MSVNLDPNAIYLIPTTTPAGVQNPSPPAGNPPPTFLPPPLPVSEKSLEENKMEDITVKTNKMIEKLNESIKSETIIKIVLTSLFSTIAVVGLACMIAALVITVAAPIFPILFGIGMVGIVISGAALLVSNDGYNYTESNNYKKEQCDKLLENLKNPDQLKILLQNYKDVIYRKECNKLVKTLQTYKSENIPTAIEKFQSCKPATDLEALALLESSLDAYGPK